MQTPSFFSSRLPPRVVPTLTEVVQLPADLPTPPAEVPPSIAASDSLQAHLFQRVMLRVDVLLSQRVNVAVAEVVSRHLQQMEPLLHQAIENTVYDVVREAMGQELSAQTR